MKPFLLALLMLGAPLAQAVDAPGITYYIQLVRGSDQDTPPEPQAHLIRAHVDQRLHDAFKWKNYWEIKRATVMVKPGGVTRTRVSPQREVEIAASGPKNLVISLYTNGKLTRKREQSIDTKYYIAGGDKESGESWFVIVRKDNPDTAPPSN